MDIKMPAKLKQQYYRCSIWEQLFILNFYNKEKPIPRNNKEEIVKKDINEQLDKLYLLAENPDAFLIDSENNPYLEKEYENELKALIERGDSFYIRHVKNNKQQLIDNMAKKYSEFLYEEYKHLVSVIKYSAYENSFKYLMLNETLTRIYRKEKGNILSEKRELNKSISEHMALGYDVMDYIYKNIEACDSFSKLYFGAVDNSKVLSLSNKKVQIENLNTFNKGNWIRFKGKRSCSEEEFQENVYKLKVLVADTNWCTKNLASSHLAQGDFYVFVDNEDNPHLAVKTSGSAIDEVRGIMQGQRIEPYYEDVAYEFLTKNKDLRNGEYWLKNQKWNEEIKMFIEMLENDVVLDEYHLEKLESVFKYKEYASHGGENIHLQKLYELASQKEYIYNYFKNDKYIFNKMSAIASFKEITKKLDNVQTFDELVSLMNSIYTTYNNGAYDYSYKNELISRLKEEKIIEIINNEIALKRNGELITNEEIAHSTVREVVNIAYLYKRLDEVDTRKEMLYILDYLFGNSNSGEYRVVRSPLKEEIFNKLKNEKIIKLMSDMVEIENEGRLFDVNIIKNEAVRREINLAYLYSKIDEINSVQDVIYLMSLLYANGKMSVYSDARINGSYLKAKIEYKLSQSEKIKSVIAKTYGCDIKDVMFVNGWIDCFTNVYDNKYIYGSVFLPSDKDKKTINFNAKAVFGALTNYTGYTSCGGYANDFLLPNLEYCGNLTMIGCKSLKADKLEMANYVNLGRGDKCSLLSLKKCDCMQLVNCRYIDVSKTTNIKDLNISDCKTIRFDSLEEIEEILKVKDCQMAFFTNVKKGGEIVLLDNGRVDLSNMKSAIRLTVKGCSLVDVTSLKNVQRFIDVTRSNTVISESLESVGENIELIGVKGVNLKKLETLGGNLTIVHSQIEEMPKSKEVSEKLITNKKSKGK